MSDLNHDTRYAADKSPAAQYPAPNDFDRNGKDSVEYQNNPPVPESSDQQETSKETFVSALSQDTQVEQPTPNTERALRKKDSTGVRWVDWEGIAEISEKKGVYRY